jgi:purine-nucleoside phosphorylase
VGITLLSNMAAGVLDQPLSGAEVIEAAQEAAPRFTALVRGILAKM